MLVAAFVGFIVAVYLFTQNGGDNEFAAFLRLRMVTVDTWAEWREHLAGTDLYLKYKAFNVSYEHDSVRADFLRNIPLHILSSTGKIPSSEGSTMWNEGPALHIASIPSDADVGVWKTFFEQFGKTDWSGLPEQEYLVYASIATLFQEAVLHGPSDRTTKVALSVYQSLGRKLP